MPAIHERPISFNDEMLRAILDGQKTQTRRPIKPQPEIMNKEWVWPPWTDRSIELWECPYGEVGDILWVRDAMSVCRIKLEIVCTGADRLRNITVDGARAEGLRDSKNPLMDFELLWDSIYGDDPQYCLHANPWVWVIEFERLDAGKEYHNE